MRIGVALAGVLAFIGVTYGVVTMLKGYQVAQPSASPSKRTITSGAQTVDPAPVVHADHGDHGAKGEKTEVLRATSASYVPPISAKGPWPKVVIEETEYQFGRMEVGQEDHHDFVIRNEGEADLEIAKGNTTCQCTISEVDNNLIPPGGSATITLRWKPTAQTDAFEKGAEIRTNDPKKKSFTLKIVGMVVPRLILMPSENWEIREVNEATNSIVSGFLFSPVLKEFGIVKLTYDENLMEVKTQPADENILKSLQGVSGYRFDVQVKPGMAVGTFSYPLKIHTSLFDRKADGSEGEEPYIVDVNITGRRDGPVKFMGPSYIASESVVGMGTFSSAEGKTLSLMMLVRGAPEEGLKFLDVESDPKGMKVTLDPQAKALGAAMRYTIRFEIPPGSVRGVRREEEPATVKIKTNHAEAPDISLKVHFTAY